MLHFAEDQESYDKGICEIHATSKLAVKGPRPPHKERVYVKVTLIDDVIQDKHHPEITVVYFVPDYLKEDGEYEEYTGLVRQIDANERTVVFLADNGRSAGKTIRVDDIKEIRGELVDYMDE